MGQGFYTRVDTPAGPVLVHVNRRGCKGKWTAKDDEALKALIVAAVKQFPARSSSSSSSSPAVVEYAECPTCGGEGGVEVSQTRSAKCVRCNGTGSVRVGA